MASPTHCRFKNKAAANRMASNYRKQMGLGLDGLPRRYGRQKKTTPKQVATGSETQPLINDMPKL
jgi:hypothetical protein